MPPNTKLVASSLYYIHPLSGPKIPINYLKVQTCYTGHKVALCFAHYQVPMTLSKVPNGSPKAGWE